MSIDDNVSEKRILVVEDESSLAKMLKTMLSRFGYESDLVSTGEDAIERYSKQPYDGVIMDNQLEGHMNNGIEVSQEILKKYPDAKIIFTSGTSDHEAIGNYQQFGFAGAIPKPVDMVYLRNLLYDIVGK